MTSTKVWNRAMVTGASSGIGEALARQLAEQGTELVLVARRRDRLESLAADIGQTHGVTPEVLVADLVEDGERTQVEARLVDQGAPIDCLVANAGIADVVPMVDADIDVADRMVRLNVLAVTRQVHLVLAGMVAAGHGGILITSSTASFQPTPYSATYGATKAFLTSFAESTHAEVAASGVRVTALCPGPTRTEIEEANDMAVTAPDFVYASAESVAAAGLEALAAGRALSVPGIGNKIGATVPKLLPRTVTRRMVETLYRRYVTN